MKIETIEGYTHIFGAPKDWKPDGKCMGLPTREVQTDQGLFNVSEWRPSPEEIEALQRGETIKLWVRGLGHPVVALTVGAIEQL